MTASGTALSRPLNFTLRPGQRVALVGESGAGKTALINVLLGFLPYQGSLLINGQELRTLPRESWQQQVAWVGQNPQLPALTLRENVLLHQQVPEPVLLSALQRAGVDAFLPRLPDGLDTVLGEGGIGLSVGQAQRVAVARALLKPAQLLLLDEPGAGLDSQSERHVMAALQQASTCQTTLMITHQLDELAQWDEVWVMQAGQLVQQGTWQQLIQQAGALRDLAQHRQKEIS